MGSSGIGKKHRPSWADLANPLRPDGQPADRGDPGNVFHEWQYHATGVLEQHYFFSLLNTLRRGSPARADVARLRSCSGPRGVSLVDGLPNDEHFESPQR